MDAKIEHLKMIQAVIKRMAGNSFLLKGWCVTLVSALLALSSKDSDSRFVVVALFPVLIFWILDAYFLRQERLFRKLYDKIRTEAATPVDFSMDTSVFVPETASWLGVMFSKTLALFYAAMAGAILLVLILVRS